ATPPSRRVCRRRWRNRREWSDRARMNRRSVLGVVSGTLPEGAHSLPCRSGGPAMNASTNVPTIVPPEAAARIAELGMQPEFERMLEHIRRSVPDLRRIEVEVSWPYDTGTDP